MGFTIEGNKVTTLDLGGDNELRFCRWGPMLYNKHDIYVGGSLRAYGEYCPEEALVLSQLVKPASTVIEVGANFGAHTIPLAKRAHRMIALEPQRLVFQTLCANLALNSVRNAIALSVAAGDVVGQASIPYADPGARNNFGAVSLVGEYPSDAIMDRVSVITVDMLGESCDLLKIDVEGMEAAVIRGARGTIEKYRPAMYVENDRIDRGKELIELIRGMDYKCFWHLPALFNPVNFANNPINLFPGTVSQNMVCIPRERADNFTTDLPEVNQHDDYTLVHPT
jgi:FkbM family methyltransferase